MDDQLQLAYSLVKDSTSQLITLATAVIGFSVTFIRENAGRNKGFDNLLIISWIVYLLSIIFGIWALYALSGSLVPSGDMVAVKSIGLNVRIPSGGQLLSFGAGTLLLIIYGIRILRK